MKTVHNVKCQNYRQNDIITSGTVTDCGKYVVSSVVRPGSSIWSKSKSNNDVQVNILNRVDISISEWNDEKQEQGQYLLPYVSYRIMQTKMLDGNGSIFEASVFDNENTRTQYKNALLGETLWKTMKVEIARSAKVFVDKVNNGESVMQPMAQLSYASDLIKASTMIRRSGASTAVATDDTSSDLARKASDILND